MELKIIKKEKSKATIKLDGKIKTVPLEVLRTLQKEILLEKQGGECAICHINLPEVLLIHHRDGDHSNDNIENLQLLCFNCHFLLHQKPEALHKMGDWRGRPIDVELLKKIREYEAQNKTPETKTCMLHEDRRADVVIGFDLETGQRLPQNRYYGLCFECWETILEKKPTVPQIQKAIGSQAE